MLILRCLPRPRIFLTLLLPFLLSACAVAQELPPGNLAQLTILQLNDNYLLEPSDGGRRGGMARVATLVKQIRRERPNTLFLLGGDTLSPSIISTFLKGEQMIAAYNLIGLDAATLGNHEFDFGPHVLTQRIRESNFLWLATNVKERATGLPFGGAREWVVRKVGSVKVGMLGLTMPETAVTSSPGDGVLFSEPVVAAARAVRALGQAGACLFVALTHQEMARDKTLAAQVPLDLIIGGHEHDPLEAVVGKTLITKAGSDAHFLVRIDLALTADCQVKERRHRFIPVTAEIPDDPEMARLVKGYEASLDRALAAVVGETAVPLEARTHEVRTRETNLGNWIADAIRAKVGADVALVNGGGIRTNRVVPPGPITKRDIHSIVPFVNVLVKLEMDGATLLSALEHSVGDYPEEFGGFLQLSGLRVTFDDRRPKGSRVVSVSVGGRPLDLRRRYTVGINNYLARGGDGYAIFNKAEVLLDAQSGPSLADVLVEAVERQRRLTPVEEGRIQRVP